MADVKRKYNVETTLTAQKVCQLIDDGKINDLPIINAHDTILAGGDISLGTFINGPNGYVSRSTSIALDESRVFLHYIDATTPYYNYAVILNISGETITMGTPVLLFSETSVMATAVPASLILVESDKVLLVYANNSSDELARIIDTHNSVITVGSSTTISTGSSSGFFNSCSLVVLDTSRVLCSYSYSAYRSYSIVLSISGMSVIKNTNATEIFSNTAVGNMAGVKVDDNKVLLAFTWGSNATYALVATISGTTITIGSASSIESGASGGVSGIGMVALSSTSVIVFYAPSSSSSFLCYKILTINGTAITQSAKVVVNSVVSNRIRSTGTNTLGIIIVSYLSSANLPYALSISVVGSTVTVYNTVQVSGVTASVNSVNYIGDNHTFIGYDDSTNSILRGVIISSTIGVPAELRQGKVIGVSLDTVGNVQLKGKCKALTGLTPGSKYYFDANGVISTTATGTFLGVALSATELSIPDYLIS
ncbi:hypothetical protein LNN31_13495 [Acetobacterium wieringae]|uniref:Uncharacterized protein n=1 Tax=Acetobacterium wieringae TaxID=52694 RepID=A0ABY6HB99_9FIRM|nr:hypothetical protein [Acetobacterium wieringae]UYO61790.1 hypothetical protein LNN31_13495 [Acetobacterium wieringae]